MTLGHFPTVAWLDPNVCNHKLTAAILTIDDCFLRIEHHDNGGIAINMHAPIVEAQMLNDLCLQRFKPALARHDLQWRTLHANREE